MCSLYTTVGLPYKGYAGSTPATTARLYDDALASAVFKQLNKGEQMTYEEREAMIERMADRDTENTPIEVRLGRTEYLEDLSDADLYQEYQFNLPVSFQKQKTRTRYLVTH